jgi:hypothetical protein
MIEKGLSIVKDIMVNKKKPWYTLVIPTLVVLSIVVTCIDVFLPHITLWNYVRAFLAVVLSIPVFALGYMVAYKQSEANRKKAEEQGEEYVLYRLRFSPNKRMQQSIILGAILVAIVIVSSFTALYTFCAGIVLASAYGIAAYCRLTEDEKDRKDKGLDDPRDVFEEDQKKDDELTQKALIEIRKEELLKQQEEEEEQAVREANDN